MKYKTTLYTGDGSRLLRVATFGTSAEAVEWGLACQAIPHPTDLGDGVLPYVVARFEVRQWCDSSDDWFPLADCPCMDWQLDTAGNWGKTGECADAGDDWATSRAFAGALGDDSTAPACWKCGASERIGDYCKACLSNQ